LVLKIIFEALSTTAVKNFLAVSATALKSTNGDFQA
jgi:hypothetical protein